MTGTRPQINTSNNDPGPNQFAGIIPAWCHHWFNRKAFELDDESRQTLYSMKRGKFVCWKLKYWRAYTYNSRILTVHSWTNFFVNQWLSTFNAGWDLNLLCFSSSLINNFRKYVKMTEYRKSSLNCFGAINSSNKWKMLIALQLPFTCFWIDRMKWTYTITSAHFDSECAKMKYNTVYQLLYLTFITCTVVWQGYYFCIVIFSFSSIFLFYHCKVFSLMFTVIRMTYVITLS